MKSKLLLQTGLALLVLATATEGVQAQRNRGDKIYKEVEVDDLIDMPQNFWSTGVMFYDTLSELPGEKVIKISKQKYYQCSVKKIGNCLVDAEDIDFFNAAQVGSEYIFTGTVLFYKGDYIVAIDKATLSLEGQASDTEEEGFDDVVIGTEKSDIESLKYLSMFLKKALTGLSGYSEREEIPLEQLLARKSDHHQKVLGILRRSLGSLEVDENTTANEILVAYGYHLLNKSYGSEEGTLEALPASDAGNEIAFAAPGEAYEPPVLIAPKNRLNTSPNLQGTQSPVITQVPGMNPKTTVIQAEAVRSQPPILAPPPVFQNPKPTRTERINTPPISAPPLFQDPIGIVAKATPTPSVNPLALANDSNVDKYELEIQRRLEARQRGEDPNALDEASPDEDPSKVKDGFGWYKKVPDTGVPE